MQLLLAVIDHAELVDDVLAGFVEPGITGATVLENRTTRGSAALCRPFVAPRLHLPDPAAPVTRRDAPHIDRP